MGSRKLWIGVVILVSLVISLVVAQGGILFQGGTSPSNLESMTFLSDYAVGAKQLPFYVALDRGYYKAEGISPTFLEGRGSGFAMTTLDTGQADMAIVDMTTLVSYIQKGAKVKAVMVLTEKPALGIVTLKEHGIKTLKDLEGLTIGDVRGSALRSLLPVAMRLNGADPSKVTLLNVDGSVLRIGLIQGEYDASVIYYPSLYEWEELAHKQGKELSVLLLADYINLYGYVIAANTDFLKQKPHLVRGFLRAFIRGLQDTINDPEAAAGTLVRHHPQLNTQNMTKEFALSMELMDKDAILRGDLGFDDGYVKRNLETISTALGTPIDRPASDFYTNDYLPKRE